LLECLVLYFVKIVVFKLSAKVHIILTFDVGTDALGFLFLGWFPSQALQGFLISFDDRCYLSVDL